MDASYRRDGRGGGGGGSAPRSVEDIFKDFRARRTAILRALTHDVEDFYAQCDPEKENLCLYGYANEAWQVALPAEEVPTELPEPALGINFARDGMNRRDWLALVAVHSDSWLVSVAFYYAARLNRNDRKRLFGMMNDLPTVYEVVSGSRQSKERDRSGMDNSSRNKISSKVTRISPQFFTISPPIMSPDEQIPSSQHTSDVARVENNIKEADEGYDEDDGDHSETLCGTCGGIYSADEFWIGCDVCERWYHGKCVKITPAKADSIKQYKCPSCSSKRPRQ
ncbi:PHD finger protein ALFIN-LIKE 1 isoform X1 [Oryza glaberrima]|uniref:PHD finger protein ALFIN-LIKE n=1 Tax=Oryza barthii TaxID=65489 RepID=A0A0D3G3L2_9ORYZ|nr:PHD finger protein ALFIN-LIKE 1 isoform X1 [Oryza glaberrima]